MEILSALYFRQSTLCNTRATAIHFHGHILHYFPHRQGLAGKQ